MPASSDGGTLSAPVGAWAPKGHHMLITYIDMSSVIPTEYVEISRTFDRLPIRLVMIIHGHTNDKLSFFDVLDSFDFKAGKRINSQVVFRSN